MRLVNRLRDTFQVDLSLRALLESPTIAGLATVMVEKTGVQAWLPPAALASTTDSLGRIDEMSDVEVDALLGELMRNKGSE